MAERFEAFKALVDKFAVPTTDDAGSGRDNGKKGGAAGGNNVPADLKQVFAIDEEAKKLSLRLHIEETSGKNQQVGDAMLIVLYGYKKIFGAEELGAVPMNKIVKTAIGQNARVDLASVALVSGGFLQRHGANRGMSYALTLKGTARAEAAIKEAIAKTQP